MTGDIVAFIRARLDEDGSAAREAGGAYGLPGPIGGEHWQWQYSYGSHPQVDTPVDVDQQSADGLLGDGADVGLRSVEDYQLRNIPGLTNPHLALSGCQEVEGSVARHIVRHDPARVLRGVEAKRRMLIAHGPGHEVRQGSKPSTLSCQGCGFGGPCDDPFTEDINECPTLRAVASEWSTHPDYRTEWTL